VVPLRERGEFGKARGECVIRRCYPFPQNPLHSVQERGEGGGGGKVRPIGDAELLYTVRGGFLPPKEICYGLDSRRGKKGGRRGEVSNIGGVNSGSSKQKSRGGEEFHPLEMLIPFKRERLQVIRKERSIPCDTTVKKNT